MTAIANLGPFKAKQKDPDRMLEDFIMYMEAFTNFPKVTHNKQIGDNC